MQTFHVRFPGLGWEFVISNVAFTVGDRNIYWYGLIITAGLLLALLYAWRSAPRYNVNASKLFNCVFVGLITGIIGARLLLLSPLRGANMPSNPISIPISTRAGLPSTAVSSARFLGGYADRKRSKMKFMPILDITMVGFLIGQGIGRWGNFMNQEAFGTPTDLPWRMASEGTGFVAVHPCFLYESLWCLLGVAVLHFFGKYRQRYAGQIFYMYLVWYGFERMIVEGLRTDSLYLPFDLFGMEIRVSQVLSAVIMAAGIVMLIINLKRRIRSMQIIDGKKVSSEVKANVKKLTDELKETHGITPGLAVVIVGDDPASRVYVNNKKKACEAVGFMSEEYALPAETTQEELLSLVETLNNKESINGILVQLPLPKHLDDKAVIEAISPLKDVDAFHAVNVGKIMLGEYDFLPCTPAGVMEMLHSYEIPVEGKECVVIGRSNIVGKPMGMLLLHENGTVTICHSRTKNLAEVCKRADILVAAVGIPKFVKADMVKDGAVVIDVGMDRDENGKLCGDVDFENVKDKCSYITPVPGGVGPMTIATLMKNTLKACKLQNNIK